jgi:hypothetical protein
MRFLLASVSLALIQVLPAAAQEWRRPLQVEESNFQQVQVDGFLEADEWGDAVTVPGSDPCEIRLKRQGGYVFIGVRCPDISLPILDLFLSPAGTDIYQLQVSSYLAERVLENDESMESFWRSGLILDWTANSLGWSTAVADSLAAIGINGQEMLRQAVLPYDGFEVQVREAQFDSSNWLLRVQVSHFASTDAPFVFPPASGGTEAPKDWLRLHLSSPEILSGPIR